MDAKQNRKLHALLNQLNLMEMKQSLVEQITNGRATSTKDMTEDEAKELIATLLGQIARKTGAHPANEVLPDGDKYRKRLIAMAYNMSPKPENPQQFVKDWCEKYGVFGKKKPFNDYTISELIGLIEKFKKVVNNVKG